MCFSSRVNNRKSVFDEFPFVLDILITCVLSHSEAEALKWLGTFGGGFPFLISGVLGAYLSHLNASDH